MQESSPRPEASKKKKMGEIREWDMSGREQWAPGGNMSYSIPRARSQVNQGRLKRGMLFAENHQFRSWTAPFLTPPIQRQANDRSKTGRPKDSVTERDTFPHHLHFSCFPCRRVDWHDCFFSVVVS